jgi:hypothetical protein
MTARSGAASRSWSVAAIVGAGVALFIDAAPAHAYIDPGTGSALLYVVGAIITSIYFGARSLYYRLLDVLFRARGREPRCSVALHSEDPRYESTFVPIAKALAAIGIRPTLLTMYRRDASFEPLPSEVTIRSIPPGMLGYAYLNNLAATVLVTTTPQLDVMTFRRSRRVGHYVFVQHALGESRFVRPFSYDYFDTVLCCGATLKQNIRRMEAIRSSKPKQLLETGIPHYEEQIRTATSAPAPPGPPRVLVAPSWGPLSMFETFGVEFVTEISRHFPVTVRPHPQMRISRPDLYAKICSLTEVTVDTDRGPSAAMSAASVLLSDISGITHEFAFVYERPVLVIDREMVLGGLEGELLGGTSELKEACREFIIPLPPSEMPSIVSHLERALSGYRRESVVETRDRLVYNFNRAGSVAAEQIAEIYRQELDSVPHRLRAPGRWHRASARGVP